MRARRIVAIVLVAVVVVALAGLVGDRELKSHQRDDYQAGHAAYLKADCAKALPRLTQAQVSWLDKSVSSRGAHDAAGCRALQSVVAKAATVSPATALSDYVVYLEGQHDAQFFAAARRQARALLGAPSLEKILTPSLCLSLPLYHVLTVNRAEPLAATFLAACGQVQEASDPAASFAAYNQLQTDFPKSAQARSTIPGLGRSAARTALVIDPKKWPPNIEPYRADPALAGEARMIVQNNASKPLSMLFVGPTTRLAEVTGCTACGSKGSGKGSSACPGHGHSFTVVLPAGKYAVVLIDATAIDPVPHKGSWNLKAANEYRTCFH
jgi:hypothetical protein